MAKMLHLLLALSLLQAAAISSPVSIQGYHERAPRTLSYFFGSRTSTAPPVPQPSPVSVTPPSVTGTGPTVPALPTGAVPSYQPVLKPSIRTQPPVRPILYNIRFYPDLSYQQTYTDRRSKDRVSPYSVMSQPTSSPVCPYSHLYGSRVGTGSAEDTKQYMTPVSSSVYNSVYSPKYFTRNTERVSPTTASPQVGPSYAVPDPYVITQQHGSPNTYLPVLQAAAAVASQQHQLQYIQPVYQPPVSAFPSYYSHQFLTSSRTGQLGQKLAPSSPYNEYPYYYHYYPEYVYVVPVSSQPKTSAPQPTPPAVSQQSSTAQDKRVGAQPQVKPADKQ